MSKILFYLQQEYYWPSLKPVYDIFAQDDKYELFIMIGKNSKRFLYLFLISQQNEIEKKFVTEGYKITRETKGFDAVFCGSQINKPERFGDALLCNLDHGPGIKTLRYRHFLKQPNTRYICFVEGPYRVEKFKKYGLDKIEEIYDVGLPKLDVFFNGYFDRGRIQQKYKLDPGKKVVLYAPSYKPTSIFSHGQEIASLSGKYSVIVKLHPYSWSGKYAPHSQHRFFEELLQKGEKFILVPPSDHDIMPLMYVADTMISDGSSVINEFLALGKCGIIIDLPQETHHDGQTLLEDSNREWLKNSFIHVEKPAEISTAVEEALVPSEIRKIQIEKDKNYIFSYTDGKSALRVKQKTEELLLNRK